MYFICYNYNSTGFVAIFHESKGFYGMYSDENFALELCKNLNESSISIPKY